MRKELTHELEVDASSDEIWGIYSSPNIPTLLRDELLPGVFKRLDVIHGNGGVGTIIVIEFNDPATIPHTFKERFMKIDHQKRKMEVQVVEGGYLDLGCTLYMDRIHILEKGCNSCVIESTLIYEVPDELADEVSPYVNLESLISMAEAVSSYVISKQQMMVFGLKVTKPTRLGLSVLLCFLVALVVLGCLLVGGVPI